MTNAELLDVFNRLWHENKGDIHSARDWSNMGNAIKQLIATANSAASVFLEDKKRINELEGELRKMHAVDAGQTAQMRNQTMRIEELEGELRKLHVAYAGQEALLGNRTSEVVELEKRITKLEETVTQLLNAGRLRPSAILSAWESPWGGPVPPAVEAKPPEPAAGKTATTEGVKRYLDIMRKVQQYGVTMQYDEEVALRLYAAVKFEVEKLCGVT